MTWPLVKLGDVVTIKGGGTPSRQVEAYWNGDILWASVKDFVSTELSTTIERITELGLKNSASNLIPENTVIIPTRMALGKAAINRVPISINQDLKALIVNDVNTLNNRYLLRFLLSKSKYIEENGSGATVKGVTIDFIKQIQIPLPPLETQKRIVELLDRARELIDKRKEQIALMENLVQSLFYEMFGDPVSNPKGWEVKKLGEVVELKGGYAFKSSTYLNKKVGIPLLRIGDINQKRFESKDLIQLPEDYKIRYNKFLVRPGAILMSLTGTVGKDDYGYAIFLDGKETSYLLNQRVVEITPTERLSARFLHLYLIQEKVRKSLTGKSRGIRQANISNKDIEQLFVHLPPIDLQNQFAGRVQAIEAEKEKMQASLTELEANFQSIMQRAFRGELS